MAIFGGGESGDSGLLVGIAMFCTVMSLISTLLISALLPSLALGYSFDDVQSAREEVVAFTGETITNSTPWELTNVYTPYEIGQPYKLDSDGFLYGEEITNYSELGKHADIKLNPDKKSNQTLSSGTRSFEIEEKQMKTLYDPNKVGILAFVNIGFQDLVKDYLGLWGQKYDVDYVTSRTVTKTYPAWEYSGYRYVFDPMLPFDYKEEGQKNASAVDGSLSIIWYNVNGQEGLSGGVVIYDKNKTIISNYAATDIIANYNKASATATKYNFAFQGVPLELNIRFDSDVLNESIPLDQAWTEGRWSMAITSPSAGNFLDMKNSSAFTTSLGSMVDTFIDIYTFDVPNVDNGYYQLVLWLLVVFPAELALMLALKSVFGMAGVGAGILGNILAWAI